MTGNMSVPELRRMVQSFRVHELQSLLAFANRNRFGRKQELLDRALDLVTKTNSLPIQLKVKELYKVREKTAYLPSGSNFNESYQQQSSQRPNQTQALGYMQQQQNRQDQMRMGIGGMGSVPGLGGLGSSRMNGAVALPERPNIKPVVLPFYDVVSELLIPHTLLGVASPQKYGDRDCSFLFNIPVEHIKAISYNIDMAPLPRMEVQLRFLPYELTGEVKDDFPSNVTARIDEQPVTLPPTIPTNKPGVEPKRPSRPVMITQYCQRGTQHRLTVSFTSKTDKHWAVSIYLVKRLTSDILLRRLINRGARALDFTKKQIIEKLNMASDCDIQMDRQCVSVLCPLGKVRMTLPCRARECKHLQCFDADLFLRMNEKKPTWVCPVCDNAAPFDKMIIDGYFHDVVSKLVTMGSPARDIQVFADGSWKPVLEEDGDDEDEKPAKPAPKPAAKFEPVASTSSATCTPATSPPEEICIDLTSDDDDDQPAARNATVVRTTSTDRRTPPMPTNGAHESSSRSSGSPSIIILDSPPSRPDATPDDSVTAMVAKRRQDSPTSRRMQQQPPAKKRLLSATSPGGGYAAPALPTPPPAHTNPPMQYAGYNASSPSVATSPHNPYAQTPYYGQAGPFSSSQQQQLINQPNYQYNFANALAQPSTSSVFGSANAIFSNFNSAMTNDPPHGTGHGNQAQAQQLSPAPDFNPVNFAEISELEYRVSRDLQNFLAACNGTNTQNFSNT